MRLLRTAISAELVDANKGKMHEVIELVGQEALDKAVEDKSYIYELNEETGQPGKMLFDGEKWLHGIVTAKTEEMNITIPTPEYTDERIEVVQSEIESMLDILSEAMPTNKSLKALKSNVSLARAAISSEDCLKMAKIAKTLSNTDDHPIFTVAQAEKGLAEIARNQRPS